MDKEKFRELCFLYLLNQIEEEDYRDFKSALDSGDEEYDKIFSNIKKIYSFLPLAVEMKEPPAAIKAKIFKKIGYQSNGADKPALTFSEKIAGLLGLNKPAFAFAVSIFLIALIAALSVYVVNLNKTVMVQNTQITELKDELKRNEELLAVLSSKRIEIVIMEGLQVNPAGYGKIIWDPNKRNAILQISNLPRVTSDKDYQLWLIKDNKPISAGVFNISKPDENFYKIENLAESEKSNINAFAVTLEPKGGVPQPTGDMYLLGKVDL